MTVERLGIVEEAQQKVARAIAANPHLAARLGVKPKPGIPVAPIVVKPIYERGRYIPMPIASLIAFVCRQTDLHHDAICGLGRTRRLVDARSCIAVLAVQFAPRISGRGIDDAMLRAEGMCRWYRERHLERGKLYPEYAALYDRLLRALLERT